MCGLGVFPGASKIHAAHRRALPTRVPGSTLLLQTPVEPNLSDLVLAVSASKPRCIPRGPPHLAGGRTSRMPSPKVDGMRVRSTSRRRTVA